jgi:hypothetical protein
MTGEVIVLYRPSLKSWLLFAALLAAAAVLVWQAPAERSLGDGIKLVYIHVSLIWAAMVVFMGAGALGLFSIFLPNRQLQTWQESASWVALAWYAVGVAIAMLAAKVNWGAVHWNEPLLIASLRFLAAALIVQAAKFWITSARLRGALNAGVAFFLMWSILGTPQVMHPESPIRQSPSAAIKLTFLGMFTLNSLAAVWCVWHLRKK